MSSHNAAILDPLNRAISFHGMLSFRCYSNSNFVARWFCSPSEIWFRAHPPLTPAIFPKPRAWHPSAATTFPSFSISKDFLLPLPPFCARERLRLLFLYPVATVRCISISLPFAVSLPPSRNSHIPFSRPRHFPSAVRVRRRRCRRRCVANDDRSS